MTVEYTGNLTDLFREGWGILAMGGFNSKGRFVADEVWTNMMKSIYRRMLMLLLLLLCRQLKMQLRTRRLSNILAISKPLFL